MRSRSKHDPTEACADKHCYSHHVDEPAIGAYRVCTECGHVFADEAALIDAYLNMALVINEVYVPGYPWPPPPLTAPAVEQIFFCPYCLSDFI